MFDLRLTGALCVSFGLAFAACGGGAKESCNVPACLADVYALIQSCQGAGTCTTQVNATSTATCWSNGVKFFDDVPTDTIRQTKPDGTDCFSATFTHSATDPNGYDVVFKDASGATIATGTQNSTGTFLTCDGQSFTYECASGAGGTGATTCAMGNCQ
jgi:hypothetical protein